MTTPRESRAVIQKLLASAEPRAILCADRRSRRVRLVIVTSRSPRTTEIRRRVGTSRWLMPPRDGSVRAASDLVERCGRGGMQAVGFVGAASTGPAADGPVVLVVVKGICREGAATSMARCFYYAFGLLPVPPSHQEGKTDDAATAKKGCGVPVALTVRMRFLSFGFGSHGLGSLQLLTIAPEWPSTISASRLSDWLQLQTRLDSPISV